LEIKYTSRKRKLVKNILFRVVSLAVVAASAVVIIVFYFAQTVLVSMSSDFFNNVHWLDIFLSNLLRHGLAILSNALLFTMIFKYFHDGFVKWKLAFGGAIVTSVLIYLGQLLI
jgi:membrane protein